MNHLSGVDHLANRFSIMRHGQSKANARGIIVSRIENDRRGDYGLSELGRQQALAAARGCGLPGNTVICSSDFSRASQTAEIVRAHLGAPEVVIAEALRERRFGDWEGSATANYARVWAADETNPALPAATSSRQPPCLTGRPPSSRMRSGGIQAATFFWSPTKTRCRSCGRASCG
jgi:hypothetical protein